MGFSSGGAEWSEIRVLDVERGTLLPERIYPSFGALRVDEGQQVVFL